MGPTYASTPRLHPVMCRYFVLEVRPHSSTCREDIDVDSGPASGHPSFGTV
jgi:hypothetical protein